MSACSGGGGGLQLRLGAMPFGGLVGAPAPSSRGGGGGVQQGRGRRCCPTMARKACIKAMGGLPRMALSPRQPSFRHAATHRGAGGGIGQAAGMF